MNEKIYVAAVVRSRTIETCVKCGVLSKKFTAPNPIFGKGGFVGIIGLYEKNHDELRENLRAALSLCAENALRSVGAEKADALSIAGCGLFVDILTGAPIDPKKKFYGALSNGKEFGFCADEIYILPAFGLFIGGETIAESVNYPCNTMLIDCGDTLNIISITKNDTVASSMWDMKYGENGRKCFGAAVKTLRQEGFTPTVRLYGARAKEAKGILLSEGLTYIDEKYDINNVVKTCRDYGARAKICKELSRMSGLDLTASEKFQNFLAEE
jgi:hypothetical protein